jgi:hypothetical protein
MKRTFRFDKEEDNKWYAVIPEWEGEHAELEMVLGADMLLDILSGWNDYAYVTFSDEPFDGCKTLTHDRFQKEIGWYNNDAWHGPSTIWLCSVTEFVFGSYPDHIYYS